MPRRRVHGATFHVTVAAHTHEECHVRQSGHQNVDAAAEQTREPINGGAGHRPHTGGRLFQAAQRMIERDRQDLLFVGHVVIDRGLRDAEPARQVLHGRRVVALLIKDRDGSGHHAGEVVARSSAPAIPRDRHDPPTLPRTVLDY
jgi:hypothetical protein